MMRNLVGGSSEFDGSSLSDSITRTESGSYFILSVLGFSFWFLMVVPFASHRESYDWLALVHSQPFATAFTFSATTFRPLAQAATWLGFLILDPSVFPTSVLRQTLLQGFIYGMFVLAWWLIYLAAAERRLFAVVACVTGAVFFSGYVHLFHIYGIFYVPVVLTLGALLHFHASGTLEKREVWFAVVTTVLAFWHPFATALFLGYYFGFYLDTFWQRSRSQHVQAVVILLVVSVTIAALVVPSPRTAAMPLDTRVFGFLVSYQTNEINHVASLVAFLLAQMAVAGMELSSRQKLAGFIVVSALSVVFLLKGLPLLLLWLCTILIKLLYMRSWSLFFLALAATLLPFGGGIGTPIYGLFAIMVAVYVTPLGWSKAEKALSCVKTRYVIGPIIASTVVLLMVRAGIQVPVVTRVASPLLTERERTYQLESILAWLHNSGYCGYEIAFVENAGSPIDSVESAVTRRNRPPAALKDVQHFWNTVLQCQKAERQDDKTETAIVTFGGSTLADSRPVFEVKGRYAGEATVWIRDSQ
ncbi:MAG: hypothetical protein WB780_20130 [Candidatus Acidiferrales bacterium]